MARARAEIEDVQRRQLEFGEALHQLVAHAFLQRRGGVVAGAGAIERLRHGAAIEREHLGRIRLVHAASASPERRDQRVDLRFLVRGRQGHAQPRSAGGHRGRTDRRDQEALLLEHPADRQRALRLADDHRLNGGAGPGIRENFGEAAPESLRQRQDFLAPPGFALDSRASAARVAAATAGGSAVV